ncbi:hypothetical protein Bbelb_019910 [Branchiostoma belcheri]|nr:hypothetical protein Bbelb_019910 [Branchiostoma belcheri]
MRTYLCLSIRAAIPPTTPLTSSSLEDGHLGRLLPLGTRSFSRAGASLWYMRWKRVNAATFLRWSKANRRAFNRNCVIDQSLRNTMDPNKSEHAPRRCTLGKVLYTTILTSLREKSCCYSSIPVALCLEVANGLALSDTVKTPQERVPWYLPRCCLLDNKEQIQGMVDRRMYPEGQKFADGSRVVNTIKRTGNIFAKMGVRDIGLSFCRRRDSPLASKHRGKPPKTRMQRELQIVQSVKKHLLTRDERVAQARPFHTTQQSNTAARRSSTNSQQN